MSMTIQQAIENRERCYNYLIGCGPKATTDNVEAVRLSLEALREKAEREDPQPLTIEELRQMIGEPVWTVGVSYNGNSWQGWDIIERVDNDGIYFGYSTECREWWSYNLRDADGTLCGCSWCAYRHKPKGVKE